MQATAKDIRTKKAKVARVFSAVTRKKTATQKENSEDLQRVLFEYLAEYLPVCSCEEETRTTKGLEGTTATAHTGLEQCTLPAVRMETSKFIGQCFERFGMSSGVSEP